VEEGESAGIVKFRVPDEDGNLMTLTREETLSMRRREQEMEAAIEVPAIPNMVDLANSDEEMEDAEDNTTDATTTTGKTPEDEDDEEEDEEEVGEDEEVDEGGPTAAEEHQPRQRNWHPKEQAGILHEWDDNQKDEQLKMGKRKFCRHIEKKYQRNLQLSTFNRWLRMKEEIFESAKRKNADRRSQSVPRQRVGKYADQEFTLAQRIRGMRQIGIVVETWMVDYEMKHILHEDFPTKFPEPSDDGTDEDFPFKCSDTWRKEFFKRHNFSIKTIGKKFNVKGTACSLGCQLRCRG